MNQLTKKIQSAATIIKHQGLGRFLVAINKKIKKTLLGEKSIEECDIAFDALSKEIDQGVMIDVGAHCGGSLAPFATHGWDIYAFEPDPENRKRLLANFKNNPKVQIEKDAVGEEKKDNVSFFASTESTGISSLTSFESSHKEVDRVNIVTLGDYIKSHTITSVDLLKVDTEGHDLFVLKGIDWNKLAPKSIICEFEDKKTIPHGYNFKDMADFLIEKGYHLIVSEWKPIERYGDIHDWVRFFSYPNELKTPDAWGNIIAIKDEGLYKKFISACEQHGPVEKPIVI